MTKARILVVDDEPGVYEILSRAFEAKGHSAAHAGSAEDAEKELERERFDLVLLDHVLPGATGMESLSRLGRLTKAPIHIMSGYTGDDSKTDALLLGAAGFVPKPLDLALLLSIIDALPERR